MEWNHGEFGYSATTDAPWDAYPQAVDAYLAIALPRLAAAYTQDDCPVIVFELWASSGRLIVYDSPVGICLRDRNERVYTQLSSSALMEQQVFLWNLSDETQQNQAQQLLEETVWTTIRISLIEGQGHAALAQFRSQPLPIAVSRDEYDSAFELLSGKWVDVP